MINQKHCFSRTFISLIVLMTIGAMLLLPKSVLADNGKKNEITMSPAQDNIELKAGQSFDGSFKIYNTGDEDFEFTVSASPYSVKGEEYQQDFETQSEQTYLVDWIEFAQEKYFLKAKENVEVKYTVDVPKQIPAGGQYAVLFAETAGGTTGAILSNKRVGMLLYAKTDANPILEGHAEVPQIPKIKFDSNLSVKQIIENTGNTDFEAETTIKASTLLGREVYSFTRRDTKIMPRSRRAVEVKWEGAPIMGLFNVNITTKFLDKTFEHSGWVLFISPIIMGAIALVIVALILWKHYGWKKKNF